MSAGNHTPGPWRIGTPPPNGEQTVGHKGLMVAVATTGAGCPTLANAHLISAAPELLETLVDIVEWVEAWGVPPTAEQLIKARVIIRKATGDHQ